MAVHERPSSETSIASSSLLQRLASVLPKNADFTIHHLSSAPTRTSTVYSAPPGTRPDRTYCESHFLTASIKAQSSRDGTDPEKVLVYAIEILIYSTAYTTTFFVSKADSTGYLHLLNLPKGTASPLKEISTAFLQHLVEHRHRPNKRSVISLFARAQDQYLFPGSVEYTGKHVLDDRGLIRWWSRVLDPLITNSKACSKLCDLKHGGKGYLLIPGLDSHETIAYVPRRPSSKTPPWTMGHPLREISRHSEDIPPRCLVPHFPDDPKARFLDELDDELPDGKGMSNGQWKSVKSLDQFWDMMAFRQECSAGRLVGFLWVVYDVDTQKSTKALAHESKDISSKYQDPTTDREQVLDLTSTVSLDLPLSPPSSFAPNSQPSQKKGNSIALTSQSFQGAVSKDRRTATKKKKKKKKLSGPIKAREPRIKTHNKNYLLDIPESTPYYYWPSEGRGQIIVDESDYKRNTELLLRLDFVNLELASSSSRRWSNEVRSGASGEMQESWGQIVKGTKVTENRVTATSTTANTLNVGLVRKKRKESPSSTLGSTEAAHAVNVLGSGIIRKKPKV
ncbi:histone acetylation protein-domain-containing protein [Amylocarpus encephaloides]|uniref:histone acetyltransferase n=1 Tax=Amylocarpus encephaloides TaxID=45428 RepID=A0A9P8C0D8_9HELO|nr:histone acetylation protein-domain-containing protein [Amylocarpus encephaloides]